MMVETLFLSSSRGAAAPQVNAGVKVDGVGAMSGLVVTSLVVGKYLGIVAAFAVAKSMGFNPPLGVRPKHVHMIGLLASMGLTVALFVSDVAFTDVGLQVKRGRQRPARLCLRCLRQLAEFSHLSSPVCGIFQHFN